MLLQLMLVAVALSSAAAGAAPTTASVKKLGCAESCGNLSISYPFGVKEDCYLDEDFLITCNSSKPYLGKGNILLSNIEFEGSELRIMKRISRECYEPSGTPLESNIESGLRLAKFSISNAKNKFTGMGCDTLATVQVSDTTNLVATGCLSRCSDIRDVPADGTCSGIGCSQAAIPKGVGDINIFLGSYRNHTNVSDFNPCSYAFVVEEGAFNFSRSNLLDFKEERLPMLLDWTVGDQKCNEAKSNQTGCACGENSDCHDPENGSGYICKCSTGYRGNPYLADGCRNIDECADPNLNNCVHKDKCVDTPGSYKCSCPKGYHSDGKEDGNRCSADRFLVIQIVAGFSIGATVVLVSSSWLYWIFRKRKLIKLKEKFFVQNGGLMLQQQLSRQERSTQEVVKIFTSEELILATNNYEESRIIGRGGNGTVYKGILADNRTVAIKKSRMVDETQMEQFINEVVVLSQINHRNVVKLLGCCLETEVPLLVYEFISNGTLSDHIHNESKASVAISWETRLQIAVETAGVLSYLHSSASVPIIHRDVKPTNILLDDNYTAKVSHFGASRLVPLDQDQLATVVQGTLGYLDPEYLHTSQLTEKSDVYSFGVVLVELITGKKALSFNRPEEERCLAKYFLSCLKNDRLLQVIDEYIEVDGNTEQLKGVANLAKRCLNIKGEDRPIMKEVTMELEGLIMKKMEKPFWVKIDLNSEENEVLLGEASSAYGFGDCSNTSAGYHNTMEHTVPPLDGGR